MVSTAWQRQILWIIAWTTGAVALSYPLFSFNRLSEPVVPQTEILNQIPSSSGQNPNLQEEQPAEVSDHLLASLRLQRPLYDPPPPEPVAQPAPPPPAPLNWSLIGAIGEGAATRAIVTDSSGAQVMLSAGQIHNETEVLTIGLEQMVVLHHGQEVTLRLDDSAASPTTPRRR